MLVLTRKLGEEISAGFVQIKVLSIKGKTVKIGIDAPDTVRIHRAELLGHPKVSDGESSQPQGQ